LDNIHTPQSINAGIGSKARVFRAEVYFINKNDLIHNIKKKNNIDDLTVTAMSRWNTYFTMNIRGKIM